MATEHLDQEWLNWVNINLERKCAPKDLYKIMRDHGFGVAVIKQMLGSAYPEGIEELDITNPKVTAIDYLALATPPLCAHMPRLVAQRFENDLIQLYTIDNFLSAEECEHLIAISEQHLKPSEVTHSNGDALFRTSETCDFMQSFDPIVKEIDEKISLTLGIRLSYSEPIQVQRYAVGQEFKAHHDYFAPNTGIYDQFAGESGQRTWTFMVYLNTTPKGGGTRFVDINQTFYPKQGMAVVWNNLHSDGTPNRHTLHHGMPVEEGKKVIITKWFREKGIGAMFHSKTTSGVAAPTEQNNTLSPSEQVLPSVGSLRANRPSVARRSSKKSKAKRR